MERSGPDPDPAVEALRSPPSRDGEAARGSRGGDENGRGRGPRRSGQRGDPEERVNRLLRGLQERWWRLLDRPLLWLVVFLLVGAWGLTPGGFFLRPEIEADSIAPRDVVAPEELLLLDEEATREKQRRAEQEVLPVYDLDRSVAAERDAALERLFATGRRLVGTDPSAFVSADSRRRLAEALERASDLEVSPGQARVLATWAFAPDLEDRIGSIAGQVARRGVVAAKGALLENRMRGVTLRDLESGAEREHFDLFDHLGYPDELRDFLEAELRDWPGLAADERAALVDLLVANLEPNLHPNRAQTLERQAAAAAATPPAFNRISKGEVIVRHGDRVDAATAQLVAEMTGRRGWNQRLLPLTGVLALLAMAAGALWLGLQREHEWVVARSRLFADSLLLLTLAILAARFGFLTAGALGAAFDVTPFNSMASYVYAIPFASLALVAALLLGRNPAVVLSLVFAVLVSRLGTGDGWAVVLYSLAGSLAAVYALERYRVEQRLVLTRVGVLVGLVNVLTVVVLLALTGQVDRSAMQALFDVALAFAGGLVVGAAAAFAVPVLESLLSITTHIKLVELANTNLPLLRRLAFEAPGTFQHSLMVANLAKEACEAVGADAPLAYTGALYHDVGKVFRPEYFVENQRGGLNRHDRLTPSMSALILINHVKDGVDLAKKHNLPQPIIDAIEQHHGSRLIKYFYNRALERADPDTEEVSEEKYRYPGPKPHSKVMGILMLADGVEAASRTLIEPTPLKVRTLIRTIVDDCLRDRQLDRTDLTLADLRQVQESFLRVLTTIYHQRIDYPGFDFNAEPGRGPGKVQKLRPAGGIAGVRGGAG
ncbi:MAG TPA: HDIG domain-containing protein [Thermoanaerobaculia bacterium]|nr:HDIG domain-containing protein [Thermoanaerobaculia bacterium]